MDELLNKIAREIEKSGFPLEIYCRKKLEKLGWQANGPHYVEMDTKLQELDVVGARQFTITPADLTVFANMHISCKKSVSNHWVFFKEQELPLPASRQVHALFTDDRNMEVKDLGDFPTKKFITSKSYCMAFHTPKNQIYEAIQETLSSYRFFRNFYGRHRVERRPTFNIVDVDILTLVFDGRMFTAEVDENLEVTVSEVNHVVHLHHEVQWPRHQRFTFEIVRKEFLDTYLTNVNKDMGRLVRRLKQRLVPTK